MENNPVAEATQFLSPVLEKAKHKSLRSTTLIGCLSSTVPRLHPPGKEDRESVIAHAISLLQRIHTQCFQDHKPPSPVDIFNPNDRRIITALLDLLALEGIYPCLIPGLGVPVERRAKAILPSSHTTPQGRKGVQETRILVEVIIALLAILEDGKGEVFELLRERCLVDVLAGCGELAFNPSYKGEHTTEEEASWKKRWNTLIKGIPTPQLLPLLMSLLHPQCPKWFLAPVSSLLSTIPIHRPHAIRHILQLFLSAPSSTMSGSQTTGTPDIPIDALGKAARLLGSIPRTVSPAEWFGVVAPQLLDMVRHEQDEGLRRAAAYVVSEFLAKKGVDQVLDIEIVGPILKWLDPDYGVEKGKEKTQYPLLIPSIPYPNTKTSRDLLELEKDSSSVSQGQAFKPLISIIPDEDEDLDMVEAEDAIAPLVPESRLFTTLSTLSFLLKSHPTPLIPKKLFKPVLLPLWGLLCISKEKKKTAQWSELPRALLISYIKTAGATVTAHPTSMGKKRPLELILYNMGFTGGKTWMFGNGEFGGVEIRRKGKGEVLGMESVDMRMEEFMKLIQDVQIGNTESIIAGLFLHILSDWLGVGGGGVSAGDMSEEDPVRVLIRLKILQQILTNHTDKLGKNLTETLQVIKNVLDEYVSSRKVLLKLRSKQQRTTTHPSLRGLGKIVDPDTATASVPLYLKNTNIQRKYLGEKDEDENERMDEAYALSTSGESDSMERMTITLSLLSSLIANPETQFTEQDERLLHALTPSLSFLSTALPDLVDESISSLAINISSFLSLFTPNTIDNPSTTNNPANSLTEQHKSTYKTALSYITDPLVPIRAHGLYLLRQLILFRSPILDIPVTLRLLTSMIKDPDSFVYLNVVKCLQSLSEKHPSTVVRLLVRSYIDDSGAMTLDERLRVGEALLGTVEREGRMLVGEVAQTVAQGMIEIISRRRRREDKSETDTGDEVRASIKAMQPPPNPFSVVERQENPALAETGESDEGADEDDDELAESGNPLPPHAKLTRKHHLHIIKNWLPPPGTHLEDIRIRTSALSIFSAAIETNPLGIGAQTCEIAMEISLAILQLETTPGKGILRRAAMVCLASLLKAWDQPGVGGLVRRKLSEAKRVMEYVRGVDGDGLVREQAKQIVELVEGVWMEMLGGGERNRGDGLGGFPSLGSWDHRT